MNWIDTSTVGSIYEVQIQPSTGLMRHRRRARSLGKGMQALLVSADLELSWDYGPPPGEYA